MQMEQSNQATDRIKLITRADDAGSGTTADLAISETVEKGIVRNVSVMAVGRSVEHAAELLAGNGQICFGLHATLNSEWNDVRWGPLSPKHTVHSLIERDGTFTRSPQRFLANPPRKEEVFDELQVQLNRLRSLGFPIAYADTHMAFEWAIPWFEEPFDRWCEREGIRNYKRYSRVLPGFGYEDLQYPEDPVTRMTEMLERAEPGQYLVVGHPGYDDLSMRAFGNADYPGERVARDRALEREMFMRADVLDACARLGVRPIRYDEAEPIK
ncbi:ChbG/HpnK family deacetylase [Cohnella sp. GCM10027633]|uniref:ChbG/HpnK family deacetylase n=1 Tax=unclassified Cohnella TaxID=2636738 RepID=UPI003638ADDB